MCALLWHWFVSILVKLYKMEEPGSSNKQTEAKVEEDEMEEPENSVERSEVKVENGETDEPGSSNK